MAHLMCGIHVPLRLHRLVASDTSNPLSGGSKAFSTRRSVIVSLAIGYCKEYSSPVLFDFVHRLECVLDHVEFITFRRNPFPLPVPGAHPLPPLVLSHALLPLIPLPECPPAPHLHSQIHLELLVAFFAVPRFSPSQSVR